MGWLILGIASHGGRAVLRVPRVAGRLAKHGGGGGSAHLVHPSSGVTSPPAHDPVTLAGIALACLVVIALPFLWGAAAGLLGLRKHSRRLISSPSSHGLPPARKLTSPRARPGPRRMPGASAAQPDSYRTPVRASAQQLKTAVTLFKIACPSCEATENEPCFPGPGEEAVVMVREMRWYCHPARVVLGCENNRDLYVKLMAEWEGEVPKYMEGLHVVGTAGQPVPS